MTAGTRRFRVPTTTAQGWRKMGTGSVSQVGLAAGETLPPRCLSPFSAWSGVARRGKGDRHRRRKPLSWGSRYRGDGASPRFRDYQPCRVVLRPRRHAPCVRVRPPAEAPLHGADRQLRQRPARDLARYPQCHRGIVGRKAGAPGEDEGLRLLDQVVGQAGVGQAIVGELGGGMTSTS